MKNLMLALLMMVVVYACDQQSPDPVKIEVNENFVRGANDFAFDFVKSLEKEEAGKNYFVSPLSLHMALGMLMNGTETKSLSELRKVLKIESLDEQSVNEAYMELIEKLPNVDPKVTNILANSVWQRNGFDVQADFKERLNKYFKSQIYEENFDDATLQKINKWAADNTNQKIPKILNEISSDQVMFLINALYFKGDWALQFDKKNTQKRAFSTGGEVDMMTMLDSMAYANMGTYKALNMAYGDGSYQMRVLLPEDGNVNALIGRLNANEWQKINEAQKVQKVSVGFPKIKMEYEKKLNEVLAKMGVPSIFSGNADLSRISPPKGKLVVGFVKQNSFLEIDEKGTEAAAVTTIGIELTSVPVYENFYCDKPYIFVIYEKSSGLIQFVGKVKSV